MTTPRGWLQMEIWSSRTTKKMMKPFLMAVGVLALAAFVWRYWLNPVELRAARAVLRQARRIRNVDEGDFDKEVAVGKQLESKADEGAWTYRDHALEAAAAGTLFLSQGCRKEEISFPKLPPRFQEVLRKSQSSSAACSKNYELLDSFLRRRVDSNPGILGF